MHEGFRGCVRTEKKPQISPLRCAPVEMTSLFEGSVLVSRVVMPIFAWKPTSSNPNKLVISTGAQRSGEICGFFSALPQPPMLFLALISL